MLMEGDASGLISSVTKSYGSVSIVAEVICYYLQWDVRQPLLLKPVLPALLT
jgi:hypothetical protein